MCLYHGRVQYQHYGSLQKQCLICCLLQARLNTQKSHSRHKDEPKKVKKPLFNLKKASKFVWSSL
ncbi:unnamed protein product [Moneuplotes crassus]|uniref:Uncharacterized protein n=1 Tax=Euplotes crassus TaxID=5936 RepID=A0AAD1XVX0_EUPCR|nr:unnamed protein product [Moneuplotes crassus]